MLFLDDTSTMATNDNTVRYVDVRGQTLPDHDGRCLLVSDEHGCQFFGVDGKGFCTTEPPSSFPAGEAIFLNDGRATIHDGSLIVLPPSGNTQHFDHEGRSMWLLDDKELLPLINHQRTEFFKVVMSKLNKVTPLTDGETEIFA